MDTRIHRPAPVSTSPSTLHPTAPGPTTVSPTGSAAPLAGSLTVLDAPTLLYLQRTAGNQAVSQLLAQRQAAQGQNAATAALPGVERDIRQARGQGQPLAPPLRSTMEEAFGAGFDQVRLHTDPRADVLARTLDARAFTTGSDIFFKQGEFKPDALAGRKLLAHELTHVLQQKGAQAKGPVQRAQRTPLQRTAKDGLLIQRSQITGYTSDGKKKTPNALLAETFGAKQPFRLSAVPRDLARDPTADPRDLAHAQWKYSSAYKLASVNRARQVKATIEGERRDAGARQSKFPQTEIGSLGEQERAILGRSPTKSYEGGHLVSDKLLGDASYQEWNLAPQARKLNSPYYRAVEEMITAGAVRNLTKEPDQNVPIHMTVDVGYKDDPYSVTVKELLDRNVISEKVGKGREGETLTFNRFVPYRWSIAAKIDDKYKNDYSFPTKPLTDKMVKRTKDVTKPFLARQPSQLYQVEPGDLKKASEKYVMGGGRSLDVIAEQHYPDPANTKASGATTLPTAPPLRQTMFSEPFNVLMVGQKGTQQDQLLDVLGSLEDAKTAQKITSWSSAGYYITEAVRTNRGADRQTLLDGALDMAGSLGAQYGMGGSKAVPPALRTKLKQLLFYDCFVKLTDQEVTEEATLEPPEYIGPFSLKTPLAPDTSLPDPSLLDPSLLSPSSMLTTPTLSSAKLPLEPKKLKKLKKEKKEEAKRRPDVEPKKKNKRRISSDESSSEEDVATPIKVLKSPAEAPQKGKKRKDPPTDETSKPKKRKFLLDSDDEGSIETDTEEPVATGDTSIDALIDEDDF
jgi:hypothetical protein